MQGRALLSLLLGIAWVDSGCGYIDYDYLPQGDQGGGDAVSEDPLLPSADDSEALTPPPTSDGSTVARSCIADVDVQQPAFNLLTSETTFSFQGSFAASLIPSSATLNGNPLTLTPSGDTITIATTLNLDFGSNAFTFESVLDDGTPCSQTLPGLTRSARIRSTTQMMRLDSTSVAVLSNTFDTPIMRIDLTSGHAEPIPTDHVAQGLTISTFSAFAVSQSRSRIYFAENSSDVIYNIDAADGSITTLSGGASGSGPALSNVSAMRFDELNDLLYVADRTTGELLSVHPVTGARTRISGGGTGSGPAISNADTITYNTDRSLFYTLRNNTEILEIVAASGNRTRIASSSVGSGSAFERPRSLAFDTARGRLVYADNRLDAIVAVNPSTGVRSIVSDASVGTGAFSLDGADSLLYDSGTDSYLLALNGALDTLVLEVSPTTGDRSARFAQTVRSSGTVLENFAGDDLGCAVAVGRCYVANDDQVVEIALDTQAARTVTGDGVGSGTALSNPLVAMPNAAATTLYVTDRDLDAILSVDIATGARTVIASAGVGSGAAMYEPVDLVLSEDETQLYFVNGHAGDIAVLDLATGVRTEITSASVGSGPFPSWGPHLEGDWAQNRLLWLDNDAGDFFAVDLATGDRSIISPAQSGLDPYPSYNGATFDPESRFFYFANEASDEIIRIDVDTGARLEVASDAAENNSFADFTVTMGLAWYPATQGLLVLSADGSMRLFHVDPATDERALIFL